MINLFNSGSYFSRYSLCISLSAFRNAHSLLSKERTISVKTCGDLYEKWRIEKKFRSVPKGDLRFTVKYIDTYDRKAKRDDPVVLALHGAPGSWRDFSALASYLSEKRMRMIIPSFPDFSDYRLGIFRHSAEEKAQFVRDFLKALSVSEIDTLIVHSSAVFPGLHLCCDNSPSIKSLVMLNPGAHSYEMKSTKHIKYMRFLCSACENPIFLKIFQLFLPGLLKLVGSPVRIENALDPLLSVTCMVYSGIPEIRKKYESLSKSGMPLLYAFSNDDKLIGKKISYDLAHILGASDDIIYEYNEDGSIKKTGQEGPKLKVLSFEKGSHYCFWRHSNIVNEEVATFVASNHQRKTKNDTKS